MAQEELEGASASRLGDIADEVVVCLEVPADALGDAGSGQLDGMPALPVTRADGGPEVLARFAPNPWDAEADPTARCAPRASSSTRDGRPSAARPPTPSCAASATRRAW